MPQEHCLSDVIRDVGDVGRDRRSGRSENGWMDGWSDETTRDTRREGSMICVRAVFHVGTDGECVELYVL